MILTVTPNVALDFTYQVDQLTPGSSHRVRRVEERAGGKGVNVASVLRALGHDTGVLGFVGGATAGAVTADLARDGAGYWYVGILHEADEGVAPGVAAPDVPAAEVPAVKKPVAKPSSSIAVPHAKHLGFPPIWFCTLAHPSSGRRCVNRCRRRCFAPSDTKGGPRTTTRLRGWSSARRCILPHAITGEPLAR